MRAPARRGRRLLGAHSPVPRSPGGEMGDVDVELEAVDLDRGAQQRARLAEARQRQHFAASTRPRTRTALPNSPPRARKLGPKNTSCRSRARSPPPGRGNATARCRGGPPAVRPGRGARRRSAGDRGDMSRRISAVWPPMLYESTVIAMMGRCGRVFAPAAGGSSCRWADRRARSVRSVNPCRHHARCHGARRGAGQGKDLTKSTNKTR